MSYSDLSFPADCQNLRGTRVRLLAIVGNYLIGYTYIDENGKPTNIRVEQWTLQGRYIGAHHPCPSDLPPLGLDDRQHYAQHLRHRKEIIEKRLNEWPDAPREWTNKDRVELEEIEKQLEKFNG